MGKKLIIVCSIALALFTAAGVCLFGHDRQINSINQQINTANQQIDSINRHLRLNDIHTFANSLVIAANLNELNTHQKQIANNTKQIKRNRQAIDNAYMWVVDKDGFMVPVPKQQKQQKIKQTYLKW
jgi:uncharacterized protein HemX